MGLHHPRDDEDPVSDVSAQQADTQADNADERTDELVQVSRSGATSRDRLRPRRGAQTRGGACFVVAQAPPRLLLLGSSEQQEKEEEEEMTFGAREGGRAFVRSFVRSFRRRQREAQSLRPNMVSAAHPCTEGELA